MEELSVDPNICYPLLFKMPALVIIAFHDNQQPSCSTEWARSVWIFQHQNELVEMKSSMREEITNFVRNPTEQ